MSQRQSNLLWLRDLLEHLSTSREQLEIAVDGETVRVLTDGMLRDLDTCRRVCEAIRRRMPARQAG